MNERRYDEQEVRRILEDATRSAAPDALQRRADGLTLAELQSIAREAGVAPDAVARAAAALDTAPARRHAMGVPVELGCTVPLARAPTDREWEQLVGEIRSTFRARGRVSVEGSLREWSNGNLHICVEPTADGQRLRMGTRKGDASGFFVLGAAGLGAGALMLGSGVMAGELVGGALASMIVGASGAAAILRNVLGLPRWANERERQMQHIAATARTLLGPVDDPPAG